MELSPFGIKIIGGLLLIIFTLIGVMHGQVMKKIDDMVDSNNKLVEAMTEFTVQLKTHDQKLNTGESEFRKIESHQKEQDIKLHNLETRVTVIEKRWPTSETTRRV